LQSVKAVRFDYIPSAEVEKVFDTFRRMCNDAIIVAVATDAKSRFNLITNSYEHLKRYDLHTHYILNACEVAYAIFQRWRKDTTAEVREILTLPYFKKAGVLWHLARLRVALPCVKRPFLKLDNQTYRLDYLLLRIPTAPRRFAYVPLNGSTYHRAFLSDKSLKRGSITVTEHSVVIAFTRQVKEVKIRGQIGIDVNEKNVTWSDTTGRTEKIDTSEVQEIKERYKSIRGLLGPVAQKDRRVGRALHQKYGKREHDRCSQFLHRITGTIVKHAKENHLGIRLERLKGIRKLYQRGNHQGALYRGRMNSWMFGEIQRQIEYKAAWDGVPVAYVNPRGTSRICLCGSRVKDVGNRQLRCPVCGKTWDRDELASKNVMAAPLVRVARPSRRSDDG